MSVIDRSSRPEVRNPVLGLPAAVQALRSLDPQQRAALKVVLMEIRKEALSRERESYRRRKGPMVSYWMAAATYLKHIAHALGKQHA
ncbi:hypothetical protein [Sphingomonas sp. ABOLE]|uniref:hypothetical protein n=1 Tax=Sphingomonas sp. ABOLE TaxID=1985878 RepID=UPI001F49EECA|nr:hypothetical protein [Sphingomonas sp. ABOLE]